jgi:hypothetical protein
VTGATIAYPSQPSAHDRELFDRVWAADRPAQWREMNAEWLKTCTDLHGIDVATAMLWAGIRSSAENREFIERVDRGTPEVESPPPLMLIVPGAFHRHHDHSGADGRRLVAIAEDLGWNWERLAVPSLGRLEENAAAIVTWLRAHKDKRVLIVSLSKGSSDVVMALRHTSAQYAFANVCGWVSVSGMVHGTPLVAWLKQHRLRTLGVHLWLWVRRQRFAALAELSRGQNGPLDAEIVLPKNLRAIQVVGFPLSTHLRHPWAPRGYERLSPLGPNDGGGILLGDLTRWPGLIYPVWGADHYLRPEWDVESTLRNILLHATASQTTASTPPASKSIA